MTSLEQQVATGLAWGVKRSFLEYLSGVGGDAAFGPGVEPTPTGAFLFESAEEAVDETSGGRLLRFGGLVRFEAHGGVLFVQIAEPAVLVRADGTGQLTIADYLTEQAERLVIADVRFERRPFGAGLEMLESLEVSLSPDAVEVFNGVYPAGQQLDPVRIVRRS